MSLQPLIDNSESQVTTSDRRDQYMNAWERIGYRRLRRTGAVAYDLKESACTVYVLPHTMRVWVATKAARKQQQQQQTEADAL